MMVAAPPVSSALQSFLAFDFGLQRTGVAYASRLLGRRNRKARSRPVVTPNGP